MPEIELSELPEDLRVKLTDKGTKELWHRVNEFGGIKTLSNSFEFSQSKMYNWKNKDLALPLKFAKRLMGENSTDEIKLLKGRGSTGNIKNPEFPLKISDELLTRVKLSVVQNSEQTPTYIVSERSLAERFIELLENLGQVEHKIYSRQSRYEVRYPKFLHEIFSNLDFEQNLTAQIDEEGKIINNKIILNNREIPLNKFEGKLYSREKSFELALQRGNSDKIAKLMAEESDKVRNLIGN